MNEWDERDQECMKMSQYACEQENNVENISLNVEEKCKGDL